MTIKEAIEHCTQIALGCKLNGENLECAKNHLQLGNWLNELLILRDKVKKLEDENYLLRNKLNKARRGALY